METLQVTASLAIPMAEIVLRAVPAQGPGGQHVNRAATAVQLRFDIHASSLPETVKARLLARADQRITAGGVVVIRAQESRSLERNRQAALERLAALVRAACQRRRPRRPTRPSRAARERRLAAKRRRGLGKRLRSARNLDEM